MSSSDLVRRNSLTKVLLMLSTSANLVLIASMFVLINIVNKLKNSLFNHGLSKRYNKYVNYSLGLVVAGISIASGGFGLAAALTAPQAYGIASSVLAIAAGIIGGAELTYTTFGRRYVADNSTLQIGQMVRHNGTDFHQAAIYHELWKDKNVTITNISVPMEEAVSLFDWQLANDCYGDCYWEAYKGNLTKRGSHPEYQVKFATMSYDGRAHGVLPYDKISAEQFGYNIYDFVRGDDTDGWKYCVGLSGTSKLVYGTEYDNSDFNCEYGAGEIYFNTWGGIDGYCDNLQSAEDCSTFGCQ